MKLLLSPRLSTAILSLLAIFSGVDSHATEVRHCLTGTGFVRIFVEHWHDWNYYNSLQDLYYEDVGLRILTTNDGTPAPTPAPVSLKDYGSDPTGELGRCEGDCDTSSDCAAGLFCFQRDNYTPVPGCSGTGTSGFDYCTTGAPGETLVSPVGLLNNVDADNLPGCAPGVTPTLDNTCSGRGGFYLDWIYFDLPYACDDSSASYTIVASSTLFLTSTTGSCDDGNSLYPTTVASFGGCSNQAAPNPGAPVLNPYPCAASNYAGQTLYVPGNGRCYKVEMFVGGRLYYLNREENCSSARFDARNKNPRLSQFDYIYGDTVYFKTFQNYGYTGQMTFKSDAALTDINFAMGQAPDHIAKTFNIELTYPSCGLG
jgi:hypothetical protein